MAQHLSEANPIIGINEGHNVIWIICCSLGPYLSLSLVPNAPLLMNDFREWRLTKNDCTDNGLESDDDDEECLKSTTVYGQVRIACTFAQKCGGVTRFGCVAA